MRTAAKSKPVQVAPGAQADVARRLAQADVEAAVSLVRGRVIDVPLDQLVPDPTQPRTIFDAVALQELADDIKQRGVENPILVRSDGFQYVIKHGERRWRASKLAGCKTIPCLPAAPAAEERPEVERLFDQAADNHHQRHLTPIEWGQVFKRLVDQYEIAVKDIPTELERRGIRSMSRPYISNLMRLLDLPDWAQAMVSAGTLNATHGKEILIAKDSPKAMQALQKEIEGWDEIKHGPLTAEAIREATEDAFESTHIELDISYGAIAPHFDIRTCNGCENKKQFQARDRERKFCLNKTCFDDKQAKADARANAKNDRERSLARDSAKPKKPAGPTKINPKKIGDGGVVTIGSLSADKYQFLDTHNVRFEPAMHCTGCEHNRPAVQYKNDAARPCCFNIPHFNELQRSGSREEGVAQWLDQRLLPEVLAKLPGNHELQFQILAWMALAAPVQNDNGNAIREELRKQQRIVRRRLKLTTPAGIIQTFAQGALDVESIAAGGVRAMLADRGNFYAFARHLGIKVTAANASLDREYLDLKRKAEMIGLLRSLDVPNAGDVVDNMAKKKLDEIVAYCLTPEVVEAAGVPPDVRALYERLQPLVDPEDEDVTDDPDDVEDDVSGETEDEPADDDSNDS